MAARRKQESEPPPRRPAMDREEAEHELINLAMAEARRQIEAGTASSQIITHYLKAGSMRERLEQQGLEYENELRLARTEAIQARVHLDELFSAAMADLKGYMGRDEPDVLPD